jgi:hypothetical protein
MHRALEANRAQWHTRKPKPTVTTPQQTRQVFIRERDRLTWEILLGRLLRIRTCRLARTLLGRCAARHAYTHTHTEHTKATTFSLPFVSALQLSCRLQTLHQYVHNTPVSVNRLPVLPVFLSLTPSFVVWQSKYVAYVHNIPRFGHSNDIALLTSPTKADDYKDGVRMVAVYSGFSL